MKKASILFVFIISFTVIMAEPNEPCKGVLVPAEMQTGKMIFEIPTYDEYVHSVVLESLLSGEVVSEDNILSESTFKKVRANKIKSIKENYANDFEIKTRRDIESSRLTEGFVFKEKFISALISDSNSKFEEYNAFVIQDLSNDKKYTLVNPAEDGSSTCMVKKDDYKFDELLAIIQR